MIGKEKDVSNSAVERSIRHAIQKSYNIKPILNEIYQCIPDNSAFLYDLVFNFDILQGHCED